MSSSPSRFNETSSGTSAATVETEPVALTTATPPASSPATDEATKSSLYRVIWRWHFYAGLIVAPVFLIAAATGALYTFKVEVSDWLYADLYFVQPQEQRLSYDEQWDLVQREAGELELDAMRVSPNPRRSTQFIVHLDAGGASEAEHKHKRFFVNPYTGELLGTQIREKEFFYRVVNMHRTLFAGLTGRILVELATSWGLVLLLTGVCLWWPRTKGGARGVWRPRLRGKPYAVLRDWHAVSGIYVLVFAFIMLATGIFMSPIFGGAYTWLSAQAGQSLAGVLLAPVESKPAPPGTPPASLEKVVSGILAQSRPGEGIYIAAPLKPEHSYKSFLMRNEDVNTVRAIHVDRYTGETLSVMNTEELPPMLRGLAVVSSLHQGKTFGITSKIIAFFSCLVLCGMVVTGVWMWWQRRPAGRTGFPARPTPGSVPQWVWAVVVLVGLVLPVVGASLILIAAGRWLVDQVGRWVRPEPRVS